MKKRDTQVLTQIIDKRRTIIVIEGESFLSCEDISLWTDWWCASQPLCYTNQGPRIDNTTKVSSIIDDDGNWDLTPIQDLIGQAILSIYKPRYVTFTNSPHWKGSTSGDYSTSAAYQATLEHENTGGDWQCKTTREDIHHLLKRWPKAKVVWLNLRNYVWWQNNNTLPLQEWIKTNMRSKLKLNTDGSSKGDPRQSGYGGLIRDKVRTWVWSYHGYLGNCTSLEVELWEIYKGLTIIMQKGLSNIEIETDSQTTMELVRDGAAGNSPYKAVIEDANFLLRRCSCLIQAIPREANQCANALANLRVNQQEYLVFLKDPSSFMFSLLIADVVNVNSRRD
ncbi:unnamed protein product [Camellia sinensis]